MTSHLARNAAIYVGANVINAGIPFLLIPVLTRVLSPADYGIIAMFGIVLSIFGAVVGLNVHGVIAVRYFQLSTTALAEYVGSCTAILVASVAAGFVVVLLLGSLLVDLTGVPLDWILVAVVYSGFQFIVNVRLVLWQVSGSALRYAIFQISQGLLNAGISLVMILLLGLAWEGRLIGQGIAVCSFGAIGIYWVWRDGLLKAPSKWRPLIDDALKFGLPLVPHVLGGVLIASIDRMIVGQLLGLGQAGIYMVALQLGQALGILTESFNRAYAPWLMSRLNQPSEAIRKRIVKGAYIYFLVVLFMAGNGGLVAQWVMPLFVGPAFLESSTLVVYILFGYAFGGCYYMVTNYIFYVAKTGLLAIVTFGSGLIGIPLMIILVELNGMTGAAQAFMLVQLLSFATTWALAQKVYPMPWLPTRKKSMMSDDVSL